jgi:hypothetical protein
MALSVTAVSTRVSPFTIEEAQAAGLAGKDNWKKYPAAMLRARCVSALSRAVYPEAVLGIYESTSEEIEAPAHVVEPVSVVGKSVGAAAFDKMVSRATVDVTPEPARKVYPSTIDGPGSQLAAMQIADAAVEPATDGADASQITERIMAAASVAELSAIAKDLGNAVTAKRVSQKEAFVIRKLGNDRRIELKAATPRSAPVDDFAAATREDAHDAEQGRQPGED